MYYYDHQRSHIALAHISEALALTVSHRQVGQPSSSAEQTGTVFLLNKTARLHRGCRSCLPLSTPWAPGPALTSEGMAVTTSWCFSQEPSPPYVSQGLFYPFTSSTASTRWVQERDVCLSVCSQQKPCRDSLVCSVTEVNKCLRA